MTLLHELAHIWHWSLDGRSAFDDLEAIVGGEAFGGPSVAWVDRSEERLAEVIAWGLLEQPRRPVHLGIPCADIYEQFVALTGTQPLEPIEVVCLPL